MSYGFNTDNFYNMNNMGNMYNNPYSSAMMMQMQNQALGGFQFANNMGSIMANPYAANLMNMGNANINPYGMNMAQQNAGDYNNSVNAQVPQTQMQPAASNTPNNNSIINNNNSNISEKDVENVIKFDNGEQITEEKEGMFDGFIPTVALMGGVSLSQRGYRKVKMNFLKNRIKFAEGKELNEAEKLKNANRIKKLASMESANELRNASRASMVAKFNKNGGITQKAARKGFLTDFRANQLKSLIPAKEELSKLDKKSYNYYKRSEALADAAKENPQRAAKYLKAADRNYFRAKVAARAVKKAPTSFLGKIGNFFGKTLGLSKIAEGAEKLAIKHPIVGKVLKLGKDIKGMAIIQGGIELLTKVVPTFAKYGFKAGMKQLGQSAVKTAASSLGWAVGEAGATEAGALIGTAICPGIGTAVGAVCGLIGGFACSYIAEKGAEKLVGKDEYDAKNEEASSKVAQKATVEIKQNPQALNVLVSQTKASLQNSDPNSPDRAVAAKSLERIASAYNNQPEQTVQTQTAQTANPYQFGTLTAQPNAEQTNQTNDYNQNPTMNNGFAYNNNMAPTMQFNMAQARYNQMYGQNPFGATFGSMPIMPQFGTIPLA